MLANESFGVLLWVWEEKSPDNMGYLRAPRDESYRMVVLAGRSEVPSPRPMGVFCTGGGALHILSDRDV